MTKSVEQSARCCRTDSASATNSWSLDALDNSTTTGSTSRTFNSKNEIATYGGSSTITYDHDGNMTTDQAGNTYTYDAWNRLVNVYFSGGNEQYTYSAGGARPGLTICDGATTTSYYSTQWQDLEDDIVVTGGCGDTTTKSTYLWSISYIDDLVARDTSVNGGSVTRVYAQQDANHDITSLTNSSGTVLERFVYDPYGKRTVLNASWSSASDSYSCVYGFQGGRLDPLDGLINFRNRDLNPTTGTWMEQDPAGYVDGMNTYQFELSDTPLLTDPMGLQSIFDNPDNLTFNELGRRLACGDFSKELQAALQLLSRIASLRDAQNQLRHLNNELVTSQTEGAGLDNEIRVLNNLINTPIEPSTSTDMNGKPFPVDQRAFDKMVLDIRTLEQTALAARMADRDQVNQDIGDIQYEINTLKAKYGALLEGSLPKAIKQLRQLMGAAAACPCHNRQAGATA